MPAPIRFSGLGNWLHWQQSAHPQAIDLGLERVARVLERTGWRRPAQPVITVGGTNGKGSCVALLEAMLRASGRRVGVFTSPHLVDYRERIRLDGQWVSDASLIAAFERIADALGGDSLTFFEHNALAALRKSADRFPRFPLPPSPCPSAVRNSWPRSGKRNRICSRFPDWRC